MLELHVGLVGHFPTITEALQAVPYDMIAMIYIAAGTYEEKIFCEKKNITLIGAGSDKTFIKWHDHGEKVHQDGGKLGTFRSYTAFFAGRVVTVKDLSIINKASGYGDKEKAIAAYVDTEIAHFENVHFDSGNGTLFCGPLPDDERFVDELLGPRKYAPRHSSFQFYHHCKISGNIDFIFGGADALFYECDIISKTITPSNSGYVIAASGKKEGAGFIFTKCQFFTTCSEKQTVYLARPWRKEGKVILLNCYLDAHIHPSGWAPWHVSDPLEINAQTTFIEHGSYGPGAKPPEIRAVWAKSLDQQDTQDLFERIGDAALAWGINEIDDKSK